MLFVECATSNTTPSPPLTPTHQTSLCLSPPFQPLTLVSQANSLLFCFISLSHATRQPIGLAKYNSLQTGSPARQRTLSCVEWVGGGNPRGQVAGQSMPRPASAAARPLFHRPSPIAPDLRGCTNQRTSLCVCVLVCAFVCVLCAAGLAAFRSLHAVCWLTPTRVPLVDELACQLVTDRNIFLGLVGFGAYGGGWAVRSGSASSAGGRRADGAGRKPMDGVHGCRQ
jgi:hypothetical protein